MRSHKITAQALWEVLLTQFIEYLQDKNNDLWELIVAAEPQDDEHLVNILSTQRFTDALSQFGEIHSSDANFMLWWEYLYMVKVLLSFTRAQRDGVWDLHLTAFRNMLPYLHRYDHINYAKWGVIYLAEMNQLPGEVATQFQQGNFVVKVGKAKFNQVDPDQGQEWLNGTGKKGGGIVDITKTVSALSRWALSFNLRAQVSSETRELYGMSLDDSLIHKEANKSRRQKDNHTEERVLDVLKRFGVFSADKTGSEILENIATKDQATMEITNALLHANELGQKQVEKFVEERLIKTEEGSPSKPFSDPMIKNKALTFSNVYDVPKVMDQKGKTLKADRSLLQRLVIAYEGGRKVDLEEILQHELLPVPISLAEMNGNLRTGQKSLLADELVKGISCPATIKISKSATLVIDGQAMVNAIGKPYNATTFGDFADIFSRYVYQSGSEYSRIDIVFDRYQEDSVKAGTRIRRKKGVASIRRIIESRDVPLPKEWQGFLHHQDNKADLA